MVSGPPAIGKTTVAKGLAKEFNLNYLSGGDILKELASEQGFSSSGDDWWDTEDGMKFLNQRKENSEFDKKVDEKLIELIFHQLFYQILNFLFFVQEISFHLQYPTNHHC